MKLGILLLFFSAHLFSQAGMPCDLIFSRNKLAPYFEFQLTEASCSLASSTPIFNSILAKKYKSAYRVLKQDELLDEIGNTVWKREVSDAGDGLHLDQLGDYIDDGLRKLDIYDYEVRVFHFKNTSRRNLNQLQEILETVSKQRDDYIIFNFMQKEFTKNPLAVEGHFSPLGRYVPEKGKAMILDPDATTGGSYWVDLKTMLKGMATIDSSSKKARGLIWIRKID